MINYIYFKKDKDFLEDSKIVIEYYILSYNKLVDFIRIGEDIRYNNGIITDFTKRARTNQSIKRIRRGKNDNIYIF